MARVRKKKLFTCDYCGNDGLSRHPKTKYCSRACSAHATKHARKKTCLEKHQFDLTLTPEFMYFCGFLWSDGHIRKDTPEVSLEIVSSDMSEVCVPKGFNMYVRHRDNRQPQSTAQIRNVVLYNFLIENGYRGKQIPSNVFVKSKESHLWLLGVIDGDGCWSVNKKTNGGKLTITSNYNQDWTYFTNLITSIGCNKPRIYRRRFKENSYSTANVFRIADIKKIGAYLYKDYSDTKIGLSRKFEKYKSILANSKF